MDRAASHSAALLVLLLWPLACSDPPAGSPKHLVLITLDTLRADRLGSYGYAEASTPALDGLAARGVRFDDAIAQAISTPPSHASILTGLNPHRHGLRRLLKQRLDPRALTLAERLQGQGFATAAFVSGLPLRRASGLDQGFAHYDDELDADGERPARTTNASIASWLETRPAGRVFLWVHYFDPHWPYEASEALRERRAPGPLVDPLRVRPHNGNPRTGEPREASERLLATGSAYYDAEVAYTDAAVAELLDLLAGAGLLDDAVIAVVADHGENLGERGYRFGHWDVFDPTARIPLLLAHPDRRFAGQSVSNTVRSIDLLPTLLAWLELPPGESVDGRDMTPLLDGRESGDREAYTEQLEFFPVRALRQGNALLIERGEGEEATREFSWRGTPGDADPEERRAALRRALQRALAAPAEEGPALALPDDVAEKLEALGYAE